MRNIVIATILAAASIGLGATQGSANSYGYGSHGRGHAQHAQYGGGWSGGHQQHCYWERQHVRVWDESYHRWSWVWRRVRVCR